MAVNMASPTVVRLVAGTFLVYIVLGVLVYRHVQSTIRSAREEAEIDASYDNTDWAVQNQQKKAGHQKGKATWTSSAGNVDVRPLHKTDLEKVKQLGNELLERLHKIQHKSGDERMGLRKSKMDNFFKNISHEKHKLDDKMSLEMEDEGKGQGSEIELGQDEPKANEADHRTQGEISHREAEKRYNQQHEQNVRVMDREHVVVHLMAAEKNNETTILNHQNDLDIVSQRKTGHEQLLIQPNTSTNGESESTASIQDVRKDNAIEQNVPIVNSTLRVGRRKYLLNINNSRIDPSKYRAMVRKGFRDMNSLRKTTYYNRTKSLRDLIEQFQKPVHVNIVSEEQKTLISSIVLSAWTRFNHPEKHRLAVHGLSGTGNISVNNEPNAINPEWTSQNGSNPHAADKALGSELIVNETTDVQVAESVYNNTLHSGHSHNVSKLIANVKSTVFEIITNGSELDPNSTIKTFNNVISVIKPNRISINPCSFPEISTSPSLDNMLDSLLPIDLPVLKNYQNPCWYEPLPPEYEHDYRTSVHMFPGQARESFQRIVQVYENRRQLNKCAWRLRCLPKVYIIGVAKSGTSDLFEMLVAHPQVVRGATKEPFFWDTTHWERRATINDYLNLFDEAAETIRRHTVNQTYHPMVTVDASVKTLFNFKGHSVLNAQDEPKYIAADLIRNLTPQTDLKIIAIIRDPTERLFSSYVFYNTVTRPSNISAEEFHLLVVEAIMAFYDCTETRTVLACAYDQEVTKARKYVTLHAGLYAVYLKDWLRVFPDMQIVRLEDYRVNRSAVYQEVMAYLGLGDVDSSLAASDFVEGRGPVRTFQMLNKTERILRKFYRPFNKQLAELLGDQKYMFLDTK